MSFDRATRNVLAQVVGKTRERLKIDVRDQLRGLGFQADGTVLDLDDSAGLTEGERAAASELRDLLEHFAALESGSEAARRQAAFDRLAREIGFTTLNRLVALRMAEERGLIVQSVGGGLGSSGFLIFERLANSALGSRVATYRAYLECLYDEIGHDLPALFDRTGPQSRIFPGERCLDDVLTLLNDPALAHLWKEDETVGWVYQYYNDPDERKKMRESKAPRTSRELAVRNQFFTPRYVVEFLTDNTLVRLWYEMRQGKTRLVERCRYLVRRKHTVFLARGQQPPVPFKPSHRWGDPDALGEMWVRPNPELTDLHDIMQFALTVGGDAYARKHLGRECGDIHGECRERYRATGKWDGSFEELRCTLFMEQRAWHDWGYTPEGEWTSEVQALYRTICERWDYETEYIPYRAPRHPRTIGVLDPAVGSAHFLLYAFDLLAVMYEEAEPDLPRAKIPALILKHNLQGIDIDPRTVQIACLALYLKARKYDRHATIKGMNVVCAAPMPGERALFEQFLATLRSPTLARIARLMWDELALAGVAGSLLKPEERLRAVVAEERQRFTEQPRERQLTLGPEYERPEQMVLDFSDVTDDSFWDVAEERILDLLRAYVGQAEGGDATTRRLFAEDSAQGFRFVDVMRQRYDVVLMNPPFGEGIHVVKATLGQLYPQSSNDLYSAFVERGLNLLNGAGRLGAITSRTGFFQTSFRQWRQDVLLENTHIHVVADLGFGVLDAAMVQTAAYVLCGWHPVYSSSSPSVFVRLLRSLTKGEDLLDSLTALRLGNHDSHLHLVRQKTFRMLPGAPFPYWATDAMRLLFQRYSPVEGGSTAIRAGLQTSDDFRFVRTFWEVALQSTGQKCGWMPFAKGGEYSPFYADIHLAVDWAHGGAAIKAFYADRGESYSGYVRSLSRYGIAGLTYSLVTFKFSMRSMPEGCIFTNKGPAVFANLDILPYLLGLFNSRPFIFCLQMLCEVRRWEVGRMQKLPYIAPSSELAGQVRYLAMCCHDSRRNGDRLDETTHVFTLPSVLLAPGNTLADRMHAALLRSSESAAAVTSHGYKIDQLMLDLYDISPEDRAAIDDELLPHPGSYPDDTSRLDEARFRQAYLTKEEVADEEDGEGTDSSSAEGTQARRRTRARYRDWEELAHLFRVHPAAISRRRAELGLVRPDELAAEVESLLSYCLGVVFGRWDARIGKNPALATALGGAWDPLPICAPGALTEDAVQLDGRPLPYRPERLPAESDDLPADYPVAVQWSGIVVDDPEHPTDDVVRRVHEVLAYLWDERATAIEQEACEILGIKGLRDHFRRSAAFFATHLSQYSKSRRQAPIYWPLSTASGSYTLWLYYPRLTSDTLFTAVNRYLEPKIAEVQRNLGELEEKVQHASGRAATRFREEIEEARAFLTELADLRGELLRVAALPYRPNLNDGVIINAAPLHKLFRLPRWAKDTRATWEKLERGEYDWAHLAYTIWPERVREKCRTDRSLAIAHGLEDLYVGPPAARGKRARAHPPTVSMDGGEDDE